MCFFRKYYLKLEEAKATKSKLKNVMRASLFTCVRLLSPLVMVKGYPPSKASVLRWAVPIKVVPPRRILVARGGAGSDREMSFNAMDSTGRTVLC